jgi:hypothetical protein
MVITDARRDSRVRGGALVSRAHDKPGGYVLQALIAAQRDAQPGPVAPAWAYGGHRRVHAEPGRSPGAT